MVGPRNPRPISPAISNPSDKGSSSRTFPFIQFEFPFKLAAEDGRYVIRRESEEVDVLVLRSSEARSGKRFRRRRLRRSKNTGEAPAPNSAATVVWAREFKVEGAADGWLAERGNAPNLAESEAREALKLLNRALAAHRVAAGDPYVHELALTDALVTRIGFGRGEQVAEGRWLEALELPEPRDDRRRKRRRMLDPQIKLAGILGGRETVPLAEELVLRARLDLDMDRPRHAALQADLALEALLEELGGGKLEEANGDERQDDDLRWLALQVERLEEMADSALSGEIDPESASVVEEVIERIERFLLRRRYG